MSVVYGVKMKTVYRGIMALTNGLSVGKWNQERRGVTLGSMTGKICRGGG